MQKRQKTKRTLSLYRTDAKGPSVVKQTMASWVEGIYLNLFRRLREIRTQCRLSIQDEGSLCEANDGAAASRDEGIYLHHHHQMRATPKNQTVHHLLLGCSTWSRITQTANRELPKCLRVHPSVSVIQDVGIETLMC